MNIPRLLAGLAALSVLAAACGGSDEVAEGTVTETTSTESTVAATTVAPPETTAAPETTVAPATTVPVADVGTVVVVAEETVLADLLSLGVPVAASSATVPDAGFSGMDEFDTAGIEIFDYLTLSLEELATYDADHIVTWQFLADQVGEEQLAGIGGEVHVLPDGTTGPDRIRMLGAFFGREDAADALLDELKAAYAAAEGAVPEGCRVSVAAIYPGANVAAFAEPVWDGPRALVELGCELVPNGGDVDTDRNGRAYLSLEQLGLLSAPTMILMQAISSTATRPPSRRSPPTRCGSSSPPWPAGRSSSSTGSAIRVSRARSA
ncbi:MAG: ABC transporter substrate-binding protein [Ilumatobacter sp.]|nr:ABC transporter substrate-binding protein [Ilumatobacter sp.]